MSFVGYFIPWLIGMVDELENWDFASEQLDAELWKNFYTAMLNMIIFMTIQVQDVMKNDELDADSDY